MESEPRPIRWHRRRRGRRDRLSSPSRRALGRAGQAPRRSGAVGGADYGKSIGVAWVSIRLASVRALLERGAIRAIQDGNHGAMHPKSSDYLPIGVPFVMAGDLTNGALDLPHCKQISLGQAE